VNICNLAFLRQLKVDQYPNNGCACSDLIILRFMVQQCTCCAM